MRTQQTALSYAVCDPQGRILHATQGTTPEKALENFDRQFDIPWRLAENRGFEVYEMTSSAQPH